MTCSSLLLVAVGLALACGATAEPAPQPNIPAEKTAGYKLVWHDEFDGTQLDSTKWDHYSPGKPRKDGYNDPSCVSLDGGGHLHITIKHVGEQFHSGMISTRGKFEAKYGYYECRARMQSQSGFWSAFWLQSPRVGAVDKGAPDDPRQNGVETDIFEYLAARPDGFQHAMHWSGYGKLHKSKGFRIEAPQMAAGWHTFGVEWRPDGYTFYLDGNKTWDFSGAVSQTEQFLLLSAEIGTWGGDIKKAKLPDDVAFDYVRVWQRGE
jgi:beta-glucanase (GH16 family)